MMTTVNMFKDHPNRENIHFVVLPILREVFYSVGDIAIDCHELMDKFGQGSEAAQGIKFDFSRFFLYGIPQLWQIYTISNVKIQKELISKLSVCT